MSTFQGCLLLAGAGLYRLFRRIDFDFDVVLRLAVCGYACISFTTVPRTHCGNSAGYPVLRNRIDVVSAVFGHEMFCRGRELHVAWLGMCLWLVDA